MVNLSSTRLTSAEVDVLTKGLTFAPTPKKSALQLEEEWSELRRRIRLRVRFGKNDQRPTGFYIKTGYDPGYLQDFKVVEGDLGRLYNRLKARCTQLLHDRQGQLNLKREEHLALRALRSNKNIVIKPADKGAAVVVMNRADYLREGMRQLENRTYYEPIDEGLKQSNRNSIDRIALRMKANGFIDTKTQLFLMSPGHRGIKDRLFYMLPKWHKSRDKWPSPLMPPGRPIVTNVKTETSNLSKWLDQWLQPLAVKLHRLSLVRDSYDFIEKLKAIRIQPDTNIVIIAGDVSDLYTNIPHSQAIASVIEALTKDKRAGRPPIHYLVQMLRIIIERNDMRFDRAMYRQKRGIAMGNNCAPSIANLYMERVDKVIRGYEPLGYWRFIDDILLIWDADRLDDLWEMKSEIGLLDPYIKIIYTEGSWSETFLDVRVTYTEGADHLEYEVYFKETDTHQLLHKLSCHPPHTCRGIVKAQLIRYKRLCSSAIKYEAAKYTLFEALALRGYGTALLQQVAVEVEGQSGTQAPQRDMLPLTLKWDPLLSSLPAWLHDEWRRLMDERRDIYKDILPDEVLVAWKRNPNIGNHLVRAKF